MALSTCKVCLKAICLMCVHEEKDGTFCSEACTSNFREVNDWVGGGSASTSEQPPPAAQPQPVAVEAPPTSSVFEEMPEHREAEVPHPDPVPIPEAEAPPPAAPSTSNIGNPCHAHPDIRAKAFCTRCRKPICGLCIIENAAGMFCSDVCVASGRSKRMGTGAKAGLAAAALLAAGAAAYALKPELFKGLMGEAEITAPPVTPPKPEPKKADPKPAPPKPEPPKPEPPKPEPPKPPPPKPEPPKPEPPKPEPPRPPAPRPPKPAPPRPTILVHPWMNDEPGTWYRVKQGGRIFDVGLKAKDPVSYTVATQTWGAGTEEKKVELEPIELLREEPLEIEGRTYLCEVRRMGGRLEWTLVTGRHSGAVLRVESPEGSREAVRTWEHTIRLGDRSFDCLVVESRESGGGLLKAWHCPTYPLRTLRLERDGALIEELLDTGFDWASRKAPK